jgi:carbon storage regulator
MLVLTRKLNERFLIGDQIVVTVVRIGNGSVRLGIEAPPEMPVIRKELGEPPERREAPTNASTDP